ncbi:uncharacterized protein LOC143616874 [Bidens hawaiensis]|uniref:uncharacterized protein LOC143616874 n=1 Tax=Bidens hawaiensis TaxID=980011 RepID=UPI004048FF7C
MDKAVSIGLFEGIKLPNGGPMVSHLFFADDATFIGEWNKDNFLNLCRILRIFSLILGLWVNLSKSSVLGIEVEDQEVARMAALFNCKLGSLPFTYLGLPVGANMKRILSWKLVIDKFQAKLSAWKANTLSFAGRLTLLKAVLGSLPTYFFSLYKAPEKVINILEGGIDSWRWRWKRSPSTAEERNQLQQLMEVLAHKSLLQVEDEWVWKDGLHNGFEVKIVRLDLEQSKGNMYQVHPFVWDCWAPSKMTASGGHVIIVDELELEEEEG